MSNTIIGVDTGTIYSAISWMDFSTNKILGGAYLENEELIEFIWNMETGGTMVVEMLEPQGSSVDEETFCASWMTGRVWQCAAFAGMHVFGVTRSKCKRQVTGTSQSNDSKITANIVSRYDPEKEFGRFGKGTKKKPGPFYGWNSHNYQALALCLAYLEGRKRYDEKGHPTLDSVIWDPRFSLTQEKERRRSERKKKSRKRREKELTERQNASKMKPPKGFDI